MRIRNDNFIFLLAFALAVLVWFYDRSYFMGYVQGSPELQPYLESASVGELVSMPSWTRYLFEPNVLELRS